MSKAHNKYSYNIGDLELTIEASEQIKFVKFYDNIEKIWCLAPTNGEIYLIYHGMSGMKEDFSTKERKVFFNNTENMLINGGDNQPYRFYASPEAFSITKSCERLRKFLTEDVLGDRVGLN